MKRNVAALLLAVAATALPVQAQLFRAYLAIDGNDANPCTLQAPCRLLPAALNAVASGGQVWMLDSANYNIGPVNVTKSVSILAVPGAVGSLVATGGPALSVATPGVVLTLENLRLSALAGATSGIVLTSGSGLTVRNTMISGMPSSGIDVSGPVVVRIIDATVVDCGAVGVRISNGPQATLLRVFLGRNSGNGLSVTGTLASTATLVEVFDSVAEGNVGSGFEISSYSSSAAVRGLIRDSRSSRNQNGIYAWSNNQGAVWLTASNSVASNNSGAGIAIGGVGTRLWVTGNTSIENWTGLENLGGIAESAGNNAVRNNAFNVTGPIASVGTL